MRIAVICLVAMVFIAMPGWADDCGCGGGGPGTGDDTSPYQDSLDGGSSSGYGSSVDPAAYASEARELLSQGLYVEALQLLNESLSLDPFNTPALLDKGDALFSLQRYPEAILVYQKVLEITPSSDEAYLRIGNACLVMRDYRAAADAYERVLGMQPGNTPALENLRVALAHLEGNVTTPASFTTLPTDRAAAFQGPAAGPSHPVSAEVPRTPPNASPLQGVIPVLALALLLAFVLPKGRKG